MPQPIETFSDVPLYSRDVTLAGKVYTLHWDYNGKEDRLYFAFALQDGTFLLRGVKVVPFMPLLIRTANFGRPSGEIVCTAPTSDDSPPGLGELGEDRRCQLWYYPVEELDELFLEVGELNFGTVV